MPIVEWSANYRYNKMKDPDFVIRTCDTQKEKAKKKLVFTAFRRTMPFAPVGAKRNKEKYVMQQMQRVRGPGS